MLSQEPLSETIVDILTSLIPGPQHGYAMIKAAQGYRSGRVMQPGLLYTTLSKLVEAGWVKQVSAPTGNTDERRRFYQLTSEGRQAIAMEACRREEQSTRVKNLMQGVVA